MLKKYTTKSKYIFSHYKKKGMTIIELIVAMALIAILSMVLVFVMTPIKQILTQDQTVLKTYSQLLFSATFLQDLYKYSEDVYIDRKYNIPLLIFIKKKTDTILTICYQKNHIFGCVFNHDLTIHNSVTEQTYYQLQYKKFTPLFDVWNINKNLSQSISSSTTQDTHLNISLDPFQGTSTNIYLNLNLVSVESLSQVHQKKFMLSTLTKKNITNIPISIQVGMFIIQFGIFPNVYLL